MIISLKKTVVYLSASTKTSQAKKYTKKFFINLTLVFRENISTAFQKALKKLSNCQA